MRHRDYGVKGVRYAIAAIPWWMIVATALLINVSPAAADSGMIVSAKASESGQAYLHNRLELLRVVDDRPHEASHRVFPTPCIPVSFRERQSHNRCWCDMPLAISDGSKAAHFCLEQAPGSLQAGAAQRWRSVTRPDVAAAPVGDPSTACPEDFLLLAVPDLNLGQLADHPAVDRNGDGLTCARPAQLRSPLIFLVVIDNALQKP
jgi:hypothetical protein